MLVFVHVSSMNTRRLGSIPLWRFVHWARRRATSGRSRSLATTVFFEAELLGVNKIPHRPIIDLKAARGELGHQPAQGEGHVPGRAAPERPRARRRSPWAYARPSGPARRSPSPERAAPN